MNWVLVGPPVWAWLVLEVVLRIRDIIRRKGSTANDGGTRAIIAVGFAFAYGGAIAVALVLQHQSAWLLGSWHVVTGEILAWAGLGIRIWAIVVLGRSFRLTVEVDSDQTVVDRGPYRWVRHPSYTGLLIFAIGYGLILGNWLSLALLLVIPSLVLVPRMRVEEAHLVSVLGQPYAEYRKRTKRLIPGIW